MTLLFITVSLSSFGYLVVDKPPVVEISLDELEYLHNSACELEELWPKVDQLVKNDSIKSKIILSQEKAIDLCEEESNSKDTTILQQKEVIKHHEGTIKKIKKNGFIKDGLIILLTIALIL